MPDTPDYSERTKERLELEKLDVEIKTHRFWSPFKTIAAILTTAASLLLTYCGLIASDGPLGKSLAIQEERIALEQKKLETSRRGLERIFANIVDEPSGIAPTCLTSNDAAVFIVVDDEEKTPFLAQRISDTLLPIANLTLYDPAKLQDNGEYKEIDAEDIEAVASLKRGDSCAEWRYLISTSHREVDKADETRVVTFGIKQPHTELEAFRTNDIKEFSFAAGMAEYFKELGDGLFEFDYEISKKGNPRHKIFGKDWYKDDPFALEIEAAVQVDDELWIGLKRPLSDSKAVVLRYRTADIFNYKTGDAPIPFNAPHLLNLGEHGITAMSNYGNCILVGSNPPKKKEKDTSKLHVFAPQAGDPPILLQSIVGQDINHLGKGIRLEGVAVERNDSGLKDLWATYDGGDGVDSSIHLYDMEALISQSTRNKCGVF